MGEYMNFKRGATSFTEENEYQSIDLEVKIKQPATHEARKTKTPTTSNQLQPKQPKTAASKAEAVGDSHSHPLLKCLGILCILLVAIIIGIIVYVSVSFRDYAAENKKLTQERSDLQTQMNELKMILENQTAEISRERENFNRTLEVIKKFTNFSLNEYCPEKKCGPCRKGWIHYQNKCYLFYEDGPWLSWSESRQYCKDRSADLVVVDDLQEQEFLHKTTRFYFDVHHGYWMGLQRTGDKWVWINGNEDKLGIWRNLRSKPHDYGLMMPGTNLTKAWDSWFGGFQNKFICEDEKVLMWSN